MAKDGFYCLRGEGHWMKVLGEPVPNYERDGREWTLELKPDEDALETLRELGLDDRINKGEEKDRILFRQRELRRDGTKNRPLTVVDADNRPWDRDVLIGNGSIIDLKVKYVNNGKGRKDSLYPQAIRVLDHKPYERQEFAPLNEEDRFFRQDVDEFEEIED